MDLSKRMPNARYLNHLCNLQKNTGNEFQWEPYLQFSTGQVQQVHSILIGLFRVPLQYFGIAAKKDVH